MTNLEKRDTYSSKSVKEAGDYSNGSSFLHRKKKRPSKHGKKDKEDEIEDVVENLEEPAYVEFEKVENEPVYCICNGPYYGDMIKCDNDYCEKEWFHFNCVKIVDPPKGLWFCCPECRPKEKKRKR